MNSRLLESKMVLHGDTGGTLAEALGITRQQFSAKKNETNGAEFTQREIKIIKERYNLTPQDVDDIFFADGVL